MKAVGRRGQSLTRTLQPDHVEALHKYIGAQGTKAVHGPSRAAQLCLCCLQ